ncbi:hypothetical protein ONE63_011101 [Megalurothrips usitatus]|uniref:ABC-2 type transporter transmembrane domain-containing protein n=1 Tax=Megalurothrips usitatus TaxID=439358 RepID=A0AAV7XJ36_9NEOP|nr:hypothetical protein ONE63_011101 [Megalurothrips usitatus]
MGYILKLKLLLWKNFLIRRRNRLRFIAELLYPLLLFFIIVLQRPSAEKVHVPECHHAENALPSSGQIPFLHSFVCRAQNQCYAKNGTLYKDSGSNPFCDLGKSWGTKDLQRFARSTKDKGKTELSPEFRGYSFRKTVDPDEPKECSDVSSTLSYLTNGALNWATAKPFFRGKILYYPETAATTAVMRRVNDTFNAIMDLDALSHLLPQGQDYMITSFKKCIDQQKVQAVTAESALKEAWALEPNNNLWALVNFEDHGEDKLAPFVKYKIRMAADRLPRTSAASDNPSMGAPSTSTAANKFITHGFAYLQDLIDEAILEQHTNRTGTARPGRILKQFPEPERIVDSLAAMLSQLLPLIMVLAWVYTFSQMAKSVVLEKQERVKEVLAVMGLGRGVQWAGWMLEGLCSAVVTCILLSVLLKYGKLTENSDVIILLLLLVSFVVAMLSFSLLVASFFSNAAIVGPAASVVYFLTYLAYQLVQKQGGPDPTYGQVVGAVSTRGTLGCAGSSERSVYVFKT